MLIALSDVIDATEAARAAADRAGAAVERLRIAVEDRRGSFTDPDALADIEDRLERGQAYLQEVAEMQTTQEQRVRAILQDVADARDEGG